MSDKIIVNLSSFPENINVDLSTTVESISTNIVETTLNFLGGAGVDLENTFTKDNTFEQNVNIQGDLSVSGITIIPNVSGNTSLSGNLTVNGTSIVNGNMSTTGFISTDAVRFDQTPETDGGVGVMRWNDQDGTLDLGLKGENVTLQLGQDQVLRVVNKTNSDLLQSEYKVVRIRLASEGGAQGQRLAVVLAQGNNDPDSVTTLGIVTEDIEINQEGFITITGVVGGINTTGSLQGENWVDGDLLYLSPTIAGGLTKVKPQAPQHTVTVGYVEYAHQNNGKIFVKIDNGYELDELHNVKITNPTNNQLLTYNSSTELWENKTPSFLSLSGGTINGSLSASGNITASQGFRIPFNAAYSAIDGLGIDRTLVSIDNANQLFIGPTLNKIELGGNQTTVGSFNGVPFAKLAINGNLAVGQNYGLLQTPTNGAIIEGNVGMGTSSPNERLTVLGNISASGSISANNLVYNSGNQTVAGVKTFTDNVVVNGNITAPNQTLAAGSLLNSNTLISVLENTAFGQYVAQAGTGGHNTQFATQGLVGFGGAPVVGTVAMNITYMFTKNSYPSDSSVVNLQGGGYFFTPSLPCIIGYGFTTTPNTSAFDVDIRHWYGSAIITNQRCVGFGGRFGGFGIKMVRHPVNDTYLTRMFVRSFDWGNNNNISNCTNTSPIVVTTPVAHNLATGVRVEISNVTGNTAANGEREITVLSPTTFSLNGSVGNGAYTAGTGTLSRMSSNSVELPPGRYYRSYFVWNPSTQTVGWCLNTHTSAPTLTAYLFPNASLMPQMSWQTGNGFGFSVGSLTQAPAFFGIQVSSPTLYQY